jgi:Ni/Co efflux regulator RcnB
LQCRPIRLLIVALIAAPLPVLAPGAVAQTGKTDAQAKPKKAKRPQSTAQHAMHDRQKKCGAEWKATKKAGKIEKGMTWPKYWSECNKRLKVGG